MPTCPRVRYIHIEEGFSTSRSFHACPKIFRPGPDSKFALRLFFGHSSTNLPVKLPLPNVRQLPNHWTATLQRLWCDTAGPRCWKQRFGERVWTQKGAPKHTGFSSGVDRKTLLKVLVDFRVLCEAPQRFLTSRSSFSTEAFYCSGKQPGGLPRFNVVRPHF